MSPSSKSVARLVVGLLVLGTACTDMPSPTEPSELNAPESSEGLLGGILNLAGIGQVRVLHRNTPLAQDETATAVIGRRGGRLYLPQAGLTVYFPRYAVRSPTTISVTAPAGDLVGYEFSPHGLVFRQDVIATQDLTGTDAGLLARLLGTNLVAAYYTGDLQPVLKVLELLRLNLLGGLGHAQFYIKHFSGYVIATN